MIHKNQQEESLFWVLGITKASHGMKNLIHAI